MANIKIKLDTRTKKTDGTSPIRIMIYHNQKNTSIATNIFVSEKYWIGEPQKVVASSCPNAKYINDSIKLAFYDIERKIMEITAEYDISDWSITELKNNIISEKPKKTATLFSDYMKNYAESRRTEKSKELVLYTLKSIRAILGDEITFDAINYQCIKSLDVEFIKRGLSTNTRGIHFRNLRAVINSAIDDEILEQEKYPFRKFKIKSAKKEKEYISEQKMHLFMEYKPKTQAQQLAKDLFFASFFLCGANPIDIYNMPYVERKVSFVRTKIARTEPEKINISIQPELREIVERNKGREYLFDFQEKYPTHRKMIDSIRKAMKNIGKELGIKLNFYMARYSWATYAAKLDISDNVIGKALGHTDKTITGSRYISFDWSKVDKANRMVIDYIKEGS